MSRRKLSAPMSRESLALLFEYRPETGELISLQAHRRWPAGRRAGSDNGTGHRRVRVNGQNYYTADLIWFLITGDWPTFTVDHKDRDGLNDRWDNLRRATTSENIFNAKLRQNNTSGASGVSWNSERLLWNVAIQKDRRKIHVGRYISFDEAFKARAEAAQRVYGAFASEGAA